VLRGGGECKAEGGCRAGSTRESGARPSGAMNAIAIAAGWLRYGRIGDSKSAIAALPSMPVIWAG
jgi:hypothetical protein